MRTASAGMLSGAMLLLAGCGGGTSGVVAIGPDMFAIETRGRVLSTAVERGLTEATSFCVAQGRQTELLGTRINPDNYQVAFRCAGASTTLVPGSAPIGRVPMATRPSALGPVPLSGVGPVGGPVITGQAFAAPPPRPPEFALGTVGSVPVQPAPIAGNPFGATAPAPRFVAPVVAPVVQAAPVAASVPAVGLQPLQSPLGSVVGPGSGAAFAAPPPPPQSFDAPRFAEPPRGRAAPVPAAPLPAPAVDTLQPLQSPLASPAAALPVPAAAPGPAPVFQALPPAGGALPQARSALQPVAAPR